MFFTRHLKRYINRYEKATFFVLKTSHINNSRQEETRFTRSKKRFIIIHNLSKVIES